eukprot:TRINITY_DN8710_c0_g1_i7.p1 TRINITY_DN8710_c0_g1~~TRINITY_DN8710_c0_g1_i7.p1  ORF type:complete len:615 (+),score=115.84 TRINITY_DN8710_c0_g1_i7:51-1895(+)
MEHYEDSSRIQRVRTYEPSQSPHGRISSHTHPSHNHHRIHTEIDYEVAAEYSLEQILSRIDKRLAALENQMSHYMLSEIPFKFQEIASTVDQAIKKISGVESFARMAHDATKLHHEDRASLSTLTDYRFNELSKKFEELEVKLTADTESRTIQGQVESFVGHVINKRLDHFYQELERESGARASLEYRLTTVLQENYRKVEQLMEAMERNMHDYMTKELNRVDEDVRKGFADVKIEQENQTLTILRKVKTKLEQIEGRMSLGSASEGPMLHDFKLIEKRINVMEESMKGKIATLEDLSQQRAEKVISSFSKRILELVHDRTADVEIRLNARMDKQLSVIQTEAHEIGRLEQKIIEIQNKSKVQGDSQLKVGDPARRDVEKICEAILEDRLKHLETTVASMAKSMAVLQVQENETKHKPPPDGYQEEIHRLKASIDYVQSKTKLEMERLEAQIESKTKDQRKLLATKFDSVYGPRILKLEHQSDNQKEKLKAIADHLEAMQKDISVAIQDELRKYRRDYDTVSLEIRNLSKHIDEKTKSDARKLEKESRILKTHLESAIDLAESAVRSDVYGIQTPLRASLLKTVPLREYSGRESFPSALSSMSQAASSESFGDF